MDRVGLKSVTSEPVHADHFQTICRLIEASDREGLLDNPRDLTGLSGSKLIGLLQRLAEYEARLNTGCYLEIGIFQGLSLISTARVLGDVPAVGIDNFSQFDEHGANLKVVQDRIRSNDVRNVTVVNADYEDALEGLSQILHGRRVGTYFVDGPHDYRSQLVCLHLIKPHLSESAVIVVDDCNYRHVRLANRDFLLANPEFKLVFESYTGCHPMNMGVDDEKLARQGWWNGVNVIARDSDNVLDPLYPPTHRDRTLHENDHLVHSAKYAALAPEGVAFLSGIRTLNLFAAAKALVKAFRKVRVPNRGLVGSYCSLNTFSEGLPCSHFNSACARSDGESTVVMQ